MQLASFSLLCTPPPFCKYSCRMFSMCSLPRPLMGFFSESVCISYLEQQTLLGRLLPVLEEAEFSITVLRTEEAKTFRLLRNVLAAPEREINLSVKQEPLHENNQSSVQTGPWCHGTPLPFSAYLSVFKPRNHLTTLRTIPGGGHATVFRGAHFKTALPLPGAHINELFKMQRLKKIQLEIRNTNS